MYDLFVQARTQRRGKSVQPLERRLGPLVVANIRFGQPVEFFRAHPGLDVRSDEFQRPGDNFASGVNLLDLLGRLQPDHQPIPSRTRSLMSSPCRVRRRPRPALRTPDTS